MKLPDALAALGVYRQFITYKLIPLEDGSLDKVPSDYRTGEVGIDPHAPQFHTDFATAAATGSPVGFVLTDGDPFFCIDLDHCLIDGQWSAGALSILAEFPGAACEVSASGTGLHIWGRYSSIPPHTTKNKHVKTEIYHRLRFMALGRPDATGSCSTDCTEPLQRFILKYHQKQGTANPNWVDDQNWSEEPDSKWAGPLNDDELIKRALRSGTVAGALGGKANFIDLWERNERVLAQVYPPTKDGPFDESSADAALAAHLRFWTGGDCARIQRLMERSGLKREKYDRHDYLPRTILSVMSSGGPVYQEKAAPKPSSPSVPLSWSPQITRRNDHGFADAAVQSELFKGCVYIVEDNEIMLPRGLMLDQARFDNLMSTHVFVLDAENSKTTDKAWTCFMKSRVFTFPKVDRGFFRPDRPTGEVIRKPTGITYLNTYAPTGVNPIDGDPTPFLDLLIRMFPVEEDRNIILAYLAFIAQYPGIKAQWALVLQGVEGNGKTTINDCMREIVGENHYHSPKAKELTGKFNSWCYRKLLIGVEDMYQSDVDTLEVLKPLITGKSVEIEPKGQDKRMVDFCANFIFNMNSKEGIRKTRNDRRFAVVFAAQQEAHDLIRDGLTVEYFARLRAWLEKGGFAIVAGFLRSYVISAELNPANGGRAPITSSTQEAIDRNLSPIEQEIQERIAQGEPGFKDGWISSFALDALFEAQHSHLARNKRVDFVRGLGYIPHPGLIKGRPNNAFQDGRKFGRPLLFIKTGHLSANLRLNPDIVQAYQEAQAFTREQPQWGVAMK